MRFFFRFQALGKELRIPSNFTTRQTVIDAIKRTSTNQSTLTSMFAAAAAAKSKARGEAMVGFTIVNGAWHKSKDKEGEKPFMPTRQTEVLVYKSKHAISK